MPSTNINIRSWKYGTPCERRRCALPPAPPSRLFIGTATRSCATPPLPQHRTRRQQKAPSKHTSAARRRRPSPYFVCHPISTLTRLLPIMLHICDHYHYAPLLPLPLYTHYGHCLYHSHYRLCCTIATTTTTVHTTTYASSSPS